MTHVLLSMLWQTSKEVESILSKLPTLVAIEAEIYFIGGDLRCIYVIEFIGLLK